MKQAFVVVALVATLVASGCQKPAPAPPAPPTATAPAPRPTPDPAPKPADPSAAEYDSLAAAKAAIVPGYPNVIRKPNGKYCIWPQVSPFPGVRVYP